MATTGKGKRRYTEADTLVLLSQTPEGGKTCSLCNKAFSRRCHLLRHLRTHHEMMASSGGPLEQLALHANPSAQGLQDSDAALGLSQMEPSEHTAPRVHATTATPSLHRRKCPYCSKIFSRSDSLRRHWQMVHSLVGSLDTYLDSGEQSNTRQMSENRTPPSDSRISETIHENDNQAIDISDTLLPGPLQDLCQAATANSAIASQHEGTAFLPQSIPTSRLPEVLLPAEEAVPSLIHAQSASVEAPISTVPQDFQHQISQSTNALESIPGASGSNINLGWDSAMDSSISPEQSGLFWSPKEFSSSNMQDFDLQKFLDDLMFTGDPPQQQQPQPTTQLDLGRKTLSVENISNSAGPPAGVDNQLLSLWGINEGLSTALYSKTVHFTAPEPHGSFFGDLLEGVSMRHASPFHQPHPDYQQRPFKAVVSHPPSPASTSRQPYIAQSHCTNSSTLADAQLAQRGQQLPYNAPFASLPAARVEIQSTVSADASATTAECTTHHGTLEAAENRERENNVGALLADTWQADIRDASPCPTPSVPESSHPPLTTKEVARELVCGTATVDDASFIPSIEFIDTCLYLYFKYFHPHLPVLHQPTFKRDGTPKLLLLSMCSIGCMFIGTADARQRGLEIYERLHHVIIFTRDSKMAMEKSRVAVIMAALLGQSYSLLSGQAKHTYTGEGFHGWLCTCARRAGFLNFVEMIPPDFKDVERLDKTALEKVWREWAHLETFKRACYALTIQAGEVTAYSCMPRLLPSRIARNDMDYDLLFEANTAEAWRDCLKLRCSECPTIKSMPIAQSPLFPVALMCQRFVQIFELSAFSSSDINTLVPKTDVISFYKEMNSLARRLNIKVDSTIALNQAPQLRLLEILWHYSCVAWLARMDMIAEISGRAGSPRAKALRAFETWIKTYQARLAMLHSAHILLAAAELRNVAFLVPRAIFHSALLLGSYLSHAPRPVANLGPAQCGPIPDWSDLAGLVCTVDDSPIQNTPTHASTTATTRGPICFLRSGGYLVIPGFSDGRMAQLDEISLRSEATLLLKQCTSWGVGQTLSDLLAAVSFN